MPIPYPPIKRHHMGTRFLPPQTDAPSDGPQVNSRSGPIEEEEEQRGMLNRVESHLSRVLQDALTCHLGLSNSSVSVTDEPGPDAGEENGRVCARRSARH